MADEPEKDGAEAPRASRSSDDEIASFRNRRQKPKAVTRPPAGA